MCAQSGIKPNKKDSRRFVRASLVVAAVLLSLALPLVLVLALLVVLVIFNGGSRLGGRARGVAGAVAGGGRGRGGTVFLVILLFVAVGLYNQLHYPHLEYSIKPEKLQKKGRTYQRLVVSLLLDNRRGRSIVGLGFGGVGLRATGARRGSGRR